MKPENGTKQSVKEWHITYFFLTFWQQIKLNFSSFRSDILDYLNFFLQSKR